MVTGRDGAPCEGDYWDNGVLDDLPDQRRGATAIWSGSEMILWGGRTYDGFLEWTGLRYDPATDSWTAPSTDGAPDPRWYHEAVWAGSVMIVWGGGGGINYFNSGGRYDPATDSWSPTTRAGGRTTLT